VSNSMQPKTDLINEIEKILQSGTEEEKQILELATKAIHTKRDKQSAYLSGFMGLRGEFIDEDTYRFTVPITPFLMNPVNIVHGGITASLADSTMGSLINRKLPDHLGAVTSEIKVNYISPGKGDHLISTAKIVHMGNQLCVAECRITTEKGRLVVLATGTFFIIKAAKRW
jgi:uncharacterized protein (TIGR00369 family)